VRSFLGPFSWRVVLAGPAPTWCKPLSPCGCRLQDRGIEDMCNVTIRIVGDDMVMKAWILRGGGMGRSSSLGRSAGALFSPGLPSHGASLYFLPVADSGIAALRECATSRSG
jgi:hypothetical protein